MIYIQAHNIPLKPKTMTTRRKVCSKFAQYSLYCNHFPYLRFELRRKCIPSRMAVNFEYQ